MRRPWKNEEELKKRKWWPRPVPVRSTARLVGDQHDQNRAPFYISVNEVVAWY